jgi:uncharacterized protein (TIGR00266 family)
LKTAPTIRRFPALTSRHATEPDYRLEGDDFQAVVIRLAPEQAVRAEPGSFMWMEDEIEMDTSTGGGLLAGIKRKISGESFFVSTFRNASRDPREVAFAASYPGKILPIDLSRGDVLCQRDAYLCSTPEVQISLAFTRRLGAGFFGGEGFILQQLSGTGLAFVHAGGMIIERELRQGESLRVDTGCIVGFEHTVDYDIQMVKGVKSLLFGGEGLFYALLRGPGKVWVQTTPISRFADRILGAARGGKEEVRRAGWGVLGKMLGGD